MGNENNNNSDNDSNYDNDSKSDKDNNRVSGISKINDGTGGAAYGFSKLGEGTFRFMHNSSISPKYYKSGWGGGSRAHIKTYKSAKLGNTFSKVATPIGMTISGYNIYNGYKKDGYQWGDNSNKAAISEIGSWAGAESGAFAGAAFGSACCPGVGTVIGGFIGGVAGGIGGGKAGDYIGEKIYDKNKIEE